MTYFAIRRDAIEDIIAGRLLQSVDFDEGLSFAKAIQCKQAIDLGPRIAMKSAKHGIFIFGRRKDEDHFIIFDVDQTGEFGPSDSSANVVVFIQKTLRFAIKYWQGGVLNQTERIALNSTRGVIFPFPISQQTKIRIVVDLVPDADRLARRGKAGRYLLVFKIAEDAGGGGDQPSLGNFRRFLEDLETFEIERPVAEASQDDPVAISGLSSTTLSELSSSVDPHQGYDTWMHLLTNDQKSFVMTPLTAPRRVDGPAGSGKTISLALAAVHAMRQAAARDDEYQAIFMTHSEASRRSIETILSSMGGDMFITPQPSIRRLQVSTLQGYCASILRQDLSTTEFVDPDAYDAKQLQTMYVEEALRAVEHELSSYERFMSTEFKNYISTEDDLLKLALIQHEIAVVIKGRSRESLDVYKKIPKLPNGLPINNEADKGFVWRIYEKYREQLVLGGQFDTDDVVLTALSQLSTPIWRRRRVSDGFDALFIDETHLFNMNELSIFHHLTKSVTVFPMAFAVDRSQAIGDRGWVDDIDVSTMVPSEVEIETSKIDLRSIFRSSPEIVNLAFTITSSGANLFTNFEDPLLHAHSNMSYEEEKKAATPFYTEVASDEELAAKAFDIADTFKDAMQTSRAEVAIIASTEELFNRLERFGAEHGKPLELLKKRGDEETINRAKSTGRFVLSLADYVGGLEFDGVVLVGIDQGRVPPLVNSSRAESRAYMTFAAHNKMYVAISRARYRVALMGTKERGASEVLASAFDSGALLRQSSN